MLTLRRGRLLYLIAKEISQKHTKFLVFGLCIGFITSFGLSRITPLFEKIWLHPVDRIGLVGDYTPTTLPLSIQKLISRGLTNVGSDGSVSPGLATSWEATESGKIYTFTLNSHVLWHTNKPVVASDINYNIRTVKFTVLDSHTVQATLDAPYSPFPLLVSKPILQSGLRGFGTYKVDQIQLKGDTVQYLRLIPEGSMSIPVKEFRFYRTEALALLAFKEGEIDRIENLSTNQSIPTWKQVNIEEIVIYQRMIVLLFNLRNPILKDDKSFRQALAYGIPDISEERAYSPISKTSWGYTDTVKKYLYDPQKAKKMLGTTKEATDSALLTITTFSQYLNIAQKIADSWSSLGKQTSVKVVNAVPDDFEILLTAQELPIDPDQYSFWHSTQTQSNKTGYVNVKIDKLLEDGRQELNQEKRKKLYIDFQKRLVEDAPAIFLYYPKTYTITRK